MNWNDWYAEHALLAARKSKDSTQVGAALIGPDGVVRLTSFNGIPKGVLDLPERRERPEKYPWVQHAERNLVNFAAKHGIATDGCTVYVTHFPCSQCAGGLIQAGIRKVIVGDGKTSMPAREFEVAEIMFREAGVPVSRFQCEEQRELPLG